MNNKKREWFYAYFTTSTSSIRGYSDRYEIVEKFYDSHSAGTIDSGICSTCEMYESDLKDMGFTPKDKVIMKSSDDRMEICYTTEKIWMLYNFSIAINKSYYMYAVVGRLTELMWILHDCSCISGHCEFISQIIKTLANYEVEKSIDDVKLYNSIKPKLPSFI